MSPAPVKSEEDREKIEYLREYAKQILATTVVKSPREYVLDEFYERMEGCAKIKTKLETMLNVTPTLPRRPRYRNGNLFVRRFNDPRGKQSGSVVVSQK